MRLPVMFAAAALLAGCSSVSSVRDAWTWDLTQPPARSAAVVAPEQAATLTNRMAQLQIQRNEIRSRISAEPDIWARQRLYEELHSVGRELSPLERQLTASNAR